MTQEQIKEEVQMSLRVARGSFYKRPEFGHRFGELRKAPASEMTRRKAIGYAQEALQWLIDYKHLKSINVFAYYDVDSKLFLHVTCQSVQGKEITLKRFVEVGNVSVG